MFSSGIVAEVQNFFLLGTNISALSFLALNLPILVVVEELKYSQLIHTYNTDILLSNKITLTLDFKKKSI